MILLLFLNTLFRFQKCSAFFFLYIFVVWYFLFSFIASYMLHKCRDRRALFLFLETGDRRQAWGCTVLQASTETHTEPQGERVRLPLAYLAELSSFPTALANISPYLNVISCQFILMYSLQLCFSIVS